MSTSLSTYCFPHEQTPETQRSQKNNDGFEDSEISDSDLYFSASQIEEIIENVPKDDSFPSYQVEKKYGKY